MAILAGLHIAIYARYSSDRQRKASIEDQIRRCSEWIVAHGGTVDPALIFVDEAISGKSLIRAGFERLMALVFAKPRRVDVIVVDDISRMSRDFADSADLFRRFQYAGVSFIGVADGIDTSAKGAKLNYTVKSLMADLYLEDLRDKTLRGLEGRMLAGYSTGGLPVGYRSVAVDGPDGKTIGYRIEIDPDGARRVVRIFRDYLKGHSLSGIARAFNSEGLAPPRANTRHRRKGWVAGTIRAILYNKKYRGTWAFKERRWVTEPGTGKRLPQLRAEADILRSTRPELRIVDEDTWLAVEARLKAVHTHYTRNEDGSPKGRSISNGSAAYLLSGIWTCNACGAPMVSTEARKAAGTTAAATTLSAAPARLPQDSVKNSRGTSCLAQSEISWHHPGASLTHGSSSPSALAGRPLPENVRVGSARAAWLGPRPASTSLSTRSRTG